MESRFHHHQPKGAEKAAQPQRTWWGQQPIKKHFSPKKGCGKGWNEVYVGKPTIEFTAEPDYSKIYVRLAYDSGIKKIEYDFNGEQKTLEFDHPKEQKEYELTLDCKEGYNLISVKVYAEEEQIYAEDSGECEYNP